MKSGFHIEIIAARLPLLLSKLHREAVLVNSLEKFEERIETSSPINDVHNTKNRF
ncbi:MAG: hypothetical protein VSS75_002190 [Candidatus Parabeggiatoa sp.]|nr:hypothetical protein [Candidatus Parabeggiatoa sp.]